MAIFRFITMHEGALLEATIDKKTLLEVMEVLWEKIGNDTYVIKPVEKNIQIGPREYEKQFVPGGIVIVDDRNRELYSLEFSDTSNVISGLLLRDIEKI